MPIIQPIESPSVKVERVAFEVMVRRSFRVGLRVGLLVGEFGRCELATDMGDGTWTIAVPALGDCLPRSTARTGGHRRKPTVMAKIV